jgi:nucleoside-diphosphate-sugar epimerase
VLFYVTGLSGTGKSAVLAELRARGHEAPGVDEDGYARWIDRRTGSPHPFPHDDTDLDLHAWYAGHRWVLDVERIGALSAAADGRQVFLCGVA